MTQQMTINDAMQFAMQQHQAGNLPQAEAVYRRVLTAEPNHPDALHLLGVIASQVGRHDVALDLINRAISLNPSNASFHRNLGRVLGEMGRADHAIQSYRKAIERGLDDGETSVLLGSALQAAGRSAEAIAAFEHATQLSPGYAEAFVFLGIALHGQGEFDRAIEQFRKAIAIEPTMPEAHSNLSVSLRCVGQFEESIDQARQAISLKPDYFNGYNNLAAALNSAGRLDDSIAVFREALSRASNMPQLHFNLGLTLLQAGRFEEGWREHEWRYKVPDYQSLRHNLPQPVWDGQELHGRRILILAEQGFGDTIHFARYVSLVAQRGGKVLFACQNELVRLMRNLEGLDQLALNGQRVPKVDFQCYLMSLPHLLKTTLETIPDGVPYLFPDKDLIDHWRKRVAGEKRLKIGIAWAGRTDLKSERHRSITLQSFAPLAAARDDIAFFSLQKGNGSDQATHPPAGMDLIDWTSDLTDFADTAALIENLDLVITIDTAVAHLAGALAKPVWVLLPATPAWRWMMDRSDSPWYPTMQLFRQKQIGDWQLPIQQIAEALSEFRPTRNP